MELTNNPVEGTGISGEDTTSIFSALLDSERTTESVGDSSEIEQSQTVEETDEAELDEGTDQADDDDADAEVADEEAEDVETESALSDETTVEIDGNTVSLKELKSGYLRQADYTRKSQELAEQRKAYQLQQVDGAQIRGELAQALNGMMQQVAVEFQGMKEPDWAYLAENEPGEYVREKERWAKREAAIKQIYDAQQEIARKDAEYAQYMRQEAIKNARTELIKRYPAEFSDAKTAKKTLETVTTYLADNGFSAEEINNTADARIIDIVYRAYKYDQIQNKVPTAVKKIEQKPALTAPGAQSPNRKSSADDINASIKRYERTQSSDAATDMFKQLLKST